MTPPTKRELRAKTLSLFKEAYNIGRQEALKNLKPNLSMEAYTDHAMENFKEEMEDVLGDVSIIVDDFYSPEIEGNSSGYLRQQGSRMLHKEQRQRLHELVKG